MSNNKLSNKLRRILVLLPLLALGFAFGAPSAVAGNHHGFHGGHYNDYYSGVSKRRNFGHSNGFRKNFRRSNRFGFRNNFRRGFRHNNRRGFRHNNRRSFRKSFRRNYYRGYRRY